VFVLAGAMVYVLGTVLVPFAATGSARLLAARSNVRT